MGVPPKRCVVVEDSGYGVQAARAAGMRVLGYAGGLTSAQ
jgi:HAD superfamily hydrolase (TIGR01509 family)